MLLAHFTIEEFRSAFFQKHSDKSPSPHGFNPVFYQKFWDLVGEEVFIACVEWAEKYEFPSGFNDTHIVLVPKCTSLDTMKDLRPISLCNVCGCHGLWPRPSNQ